MSITFEVPNLDDASADPDDYFHLANVLAILTEYAINKQASIRYRQIGNVAAAYHEEARLRQLYDLLPAWARW